MIETKNELVILKASAQSSTDIIAQLCDRLYKEGYIGDTYCAAVIAREEEYPTGLPSEGAVAAIPHAYSQDVMKTAVAVAVLDNTVKFRNISDYDEMLDVELVFLLANSTAAGEHMDCLQELMDCMSRPSLLCAVKEAASEEEIVDILSHTERYPEE